MEGKRLRYGPCLRCSTDLFSTSAKKMDLVCGAVLGCVLFAAILLFGGLFFRRRRCLSLGRPYGLSYRKSPGQLRVSLRFWERGVFNPSLLEGALGEPALLALRKSKSKDHDSDVLVASGALADLAPAQGRELLELHGFMDLRLFRHQGRTWAAAHRLEDEETNMCAMYLLSLDGRATRLECSSNLSGENHPRSEKNWVPLPHDSGALYWIHTLSPFRLLRSSLHLDMDLPPVLQCEEVDVGPRSQLGGNVRGSSVARAIDGGVPRSNAREDTSTAAILRAWACLYI